MRRLIGGIIGLGLVGLAAPVGAIMPTPVSPLQLGAPSVELISVASQLVRLGRHSPDEQRRTE